MAAAFSVGSVLGTADAGGTTQDSGSITVAAGSVMYVLVESSDTTAVAVTGVVWAPSGANQALTQIGTTIDHSSPNCKASLWRLISPSATTATVRATWGSNQGERLVAVWVGTGIDTTTPNGTLTQTTNTNASVTTGAITTTTGQLVLAMATLLSGSGTQLTFDSPSGTERNEGSTAATPFDSSATQDTAAAGASTTMTWSVGGGTPNSWAAFGIPINNAALGPTIDTQPQSATVYQGQTANFTVSATTSGGALSYQWKDDGTNVGTNSNSYTTAATVLGDNGAQITCAVTDSNGTTTTAAATLTVIPVGITAWLRG